MKSLSDYTKNVYTELFDKYGVFFAFSPEQYNERAVNGVEYVIMSGQCIPKINYDAYAKAMSDATEQAIKFDKEENGKFGIIRRELFNHECFYTYEVDDAVSAVQEYGYTESDVLEVFNIVRATEDVD